MECSIHDTMGQNISNGFILIYLYMLFIGMLQPIFVSIIQIICNKLAQLLVIDSVTGLIDYSQLITVHLMFHYWIITKEANGFNLMPNLSID